MKSRLIPVCALLCVGCMLMFTGCEPNVDNGNNNSSISTTPNIPDNNITSEGIITSTSPVLTEENKDTAIDTNPQAVDTSTAFSDTAGVKNSVKKANESNIIEEPEDVEALADEAANYDAIAAMTGLSNNKVCWGLGRNYDDKNRPLDAVNAQEKYGEYNTLFIGADENKIYLTFDEGYENGYTSRILDILREKDARATFFVTYDYCKSSPELVQRMIDEGHEVGNHSYTHSSFPECSESEVRDEIQKLHDYVRDNFDYEMKLVRFPKGEFSERSLLIAGSLGYTSVFWSYAHVDWDVNNQPDVSEIYNKVTKATHPGEIALLHAVSKTNTECLPNIIDFWKSCGYELSLFYSDNNIAGDAN